MSVAALLRDCGREIRSWRACLILLREGQIILLRRCVERHGLSFSALFYEGFFQHYIFSLFSYAIVVELRFVIIVGAYVLYSPLSARMSNPFFSAY